ncbi:hypothetical protein [Burkholderia stagnalis]
MKYYALLERKERGCPVGSMQGVVYDKFVENVRDLEYGLKPWYNTFDDRVKIFPGEMFLISRDKLIAYDIRSGGAGSKFNIISSGFLDLLKEFSVPIGDAQAINIVSEKGRSVSAGGYFIVSFGRSIYQSMDDVVGEGSVLKPDEFGGQFSIEKLSVKNGFDGDFFKIGNLYPGQDPIFCSERFAEAMARRGVGAGVELRDIEEIQWGSASADDFLGFLQSDDEPLLFIH